MTLSIPEEGLEEIRRVWAGRGGIWAGVAAVEGEEGATWTTELARRRASRVILEMIRPQLAGWPDSVRQWIDALPAQSVRHRLVLDTPSAGVDWSRTRLAGWPPKEFHHRRRSRVADTVLATATRWTVERLLDVSSDIDRIDMALLDERERRRVAVAAEMLGREPLASSRPITPSRSDLQALRASGRPWTSVAAVAAGLRTLDHDPARLASVPLDPDPVLIERLFHVAVLGVVVRGLRSLGWALTPTGLPGSPDGGPVFGATDPDGDDWDLWYEMSGAWKYYGHPAPYPAAVQGVPGTGGPLGSDVALVRNGDRAVVIECKYSADPSYVGRGGYEQVLAYMSEARTSLAHTVAGIVVGPPETVVSTGSTSTMVGRVTVTNPGAIEQELGEILARMDATALT